jgi:homoprotocatechuate degradation regulator HpaR
LDTPKHEAPGQTGFELARTQRTLPIALLRAREAVMERMRPMLHAHDITEQQWRVIRVLREEGELDATTLADHACILAPSLTRILKSLESRNLLRTTRDKADGRRVIVELTPEGRSLIASVTPQASEIYAGIEEVMGPGRVEHLLNELEFLLSRLGPRGG